MVDSRINIRYNQDTKGSCGVDSATENSVRKRKGEVSYDDKGDAGEKEGTWSYLCPDSRAVRSAAGDCTEGARRYHADAQI